MARRPTPLRRSINRIAFATVVVLLAAYPVDWAVWKALMLAGRGMSTAAVTQTTAATLKGNRFEVYSSEKAVVPCSLSILPEAGAGPCWWLHLHPDLVTQY